MTNRDREYIENRLLAPASELGEAIGRLRAHGWFAEADRLTDALAELTDVCRTVRYSIWYPERLGEGADL